jgi:HSP20 family protein
MKLTPWSNRRKINLSGDGNSSLPSLGSLRREMDQVFARFFENPCGGLDLDVGHSSGWLPSVDVVDGGKEVTVRAEIPGVDPKDIDVSVSGGKLTIAGSKKTEHQESDKDYFRSERMFGSFRRIVTLPEGVDPEKVSAEHSNGVLTIHLAKSEAAAAKRIAITRK